LITSPLTVIVGLRNIYQGVALVHKRTDVLAYATLVRLTTVGAIVGANLFLLKLPGASGGAVAILCGMSIETLFVYLQVKGLSRSLPSAASGSSSDSRINFAKIFLFSYPLLFGIAVMISLPTFINGILSRTSQPELALAGFGILYPLLRFFTSPLLGFIDMTLVLYTSARMLKKLIRVAFLITLVFSLIVFGVGYTRIGSYVLSNFFGLDALIVNYVYPGMLLMVFFPLTTGIRNFAVGMLMKQKATGMITFSSISKIFGVLGIGIGSLWVFSGINGVVLGILLVILGEICDALLLGSMAAIRSRPGFLEFN
jgi:hypothetical protein